MRSLGQELRARVARLVRVAMIPPILALGACSGYRPDYDLLAKGPSAEFDPVALTTAASNQQKVLVQLSIMAGLQGAEPVGSAQWQLLGTAALGRARLECSAYITEIMKVEEHRRTINQQLSLTGAATAGILGVAGVAGAAIAITAMAFGLVQGTVDNVTTGLLYSLGAEPVQTLVANLRGAYSERLNEDSWKDRPTSFNTIYGYLELCTPVVLREKIKSAIVNATPEATSVNKQGDPPRVTILASPNVPLPPVRPPPKLPGVLPTETGITQSEIRDIQEALCAPVTGEVGLPRTDDPTRAAIREFVAARLGGKADDASDSLTSGRGPSLLRQAVANAKSGNAVTTCLARSYGSAFEVGLFGHLKPDEAAEKIQFVQKKINAKLTGGEPIKVDGNLSTLHKGVGLLRKQSNADDKATAIDSEFYRKL